MRIGKSEAELTNKKRLHSSYCNVEAADTEALGDLYAAAELLAVPFNSVYSNCYSAVIWQCLEEEKRKKV